MAEPKRQTYSIELSGAELYLLHSMLEGEMALPDRLTPENMEAWKARSDEVKALAKQLPSPYSEDDLTRLSYLAVREIERQEAPRRATSWRHSAWRRYIKALPAGDCHG